MRTHSSANTSPALETIQPDPASETQPAGPDPSATHPLDVKSTRASRTWVKIVPVLVLLAVILVFVLQNLRSTKVSFATASGRLPLAVALLAAAALGGLLVFALGSVRIIQLRRVIHRSSKVS